jgi:dTMP kinase
MPGKYVVIEGHDGTGKSTQVGLIREKLAQEGIESVEYHEPEGTPIAGAIRQIIKNGDLERDRETNLLLFTASRHEIWNRAKKELALGKWVVSARNYFSTLAYQGYGEGLDLDLITDTTLTFTDDKYLHPDIAVILSLDDEAERAKRIAKRGELENPDTFESRSDDFQLKVKNGYLSVADTYNLPIISASQPIDAVTEEIWAKISPNL